MAAPIARLGAAVHQLAVLAGERKITDNFFVFCRSGFQICLRLGIKLLCAVIFIGRGFHGASTGQPQQHRSTHQNQQGNNSHCGNRFAAVAALGTLDHGKAAVVDGILFGFLLCCQGARHCPVWLCCGQGR